MYFGREGPEGAALRTARAGLTGSVSLERLSGTVRAQDRKADMQDPLLDRFRSDDLVMGIIGLGYVGLPLATVVADAGIRILGFDVDEAIVDGVNAGASHIRDVPSDHVAHLVERGLLRATADMARLAECDVVAISVPTPLSKTRDPDISFILAAASSVAAELRPGQLIVLESTTYPGTTREVLLGELARSGLAVGEDFFLCFSPERMDPGNREWRTRNTPKVIGGVTSRCTAVGEAFYSRFIDRMVPVSSAEVAELSKILENTFRAVNIGLVNETALIADRLGVDIWEVIEAAATKPFGFMRFLPGPGLGGHCIPVDPHYLSWKMRTLDFRTRFIELASEINAGMPRFVVDKVRDALNEEGRAVRGSTVVILGVAYKKDINDVRESPALHIIELLEGAGAHVLYHDPFVPSLEDERAGARESLPLTPALLGQADVVLILTDHSCFDVEAIVAGSRVLVDARNATAGTSARPGSGRGQGWIVKGGLA